MSKVGYVINYAGYGTDVDKEWMKRFGCTEIMEEKQECGAAYMRTKVMVRQAIYPTVSIFGYGSSTRSDIAGKPDLAVHR